MKSLGAALTVMALALVPLGCGTESQLDEPDYTTDFWGGTDLTTPYEGLWIMQSLTFDDNGVPVTLTRDGREKALLGSAWFEARNDQTGRIFARQAGTVDGLLTQAPDFNIVDVRIPATAAPTYEAPEWLITDRYGHVDVYAVTRDGNRLQLDYDEADPRNKSASPARQIVLERSQPFGDLTVGIWDLTAMTQGGQTLEGNTCTQIDPTTWGILRLRIAIDRWGLFENDMQLDAFSDATCQTSIGTFGMNHQVGYAEEIDTQAAMRTSGVDTPDPFRVNRLKLWVLPDEGNPQYLSFDVVRSGAELTLTRTECVPSPECISSTPTLVQLREATKTLTR